MSAPVLVVGVGSELRSDDAAGRRVVERLGDQLDADLPADLVERRSVHQLTPELASDTVGRRLVIVVDASVDVEEITVETVVAVPAAGAMTHHLDAATLLGLAKLLGRPPRELVTVAVPARSLALGTELSAATDREVAEAVIRVRELCEDALVPLPGQFRPG